MARPEFLFSAKGNAPGPKTCGTGPNKLNNWVSRADTGPGEGGERGTTGVDGMPQTPHAEKHFTAPEAVRDVVIGMWTG